MMLPEAGCRHRLEWPQAGVARTPEPHSVVKSVARQQFATSMSVAVADPGLWTAPEFGAEPCVVPGQEAASRPVVPREQVDYVPRRNLDRARP